MALPTSKAIKAVSSGTDVLVKCTALLVTKGLKSCKKHPIHPRVL